MGVGHSAEPNEEASRKELDIALSKLSRGHFDCALRAIRQRQETLKWEQLPQRIFLLRHGESEGNINRTVYTSKGDAHLELTPKGLHQAKHAGDRLAKLVGPNDVFVVVSPFERAQQTLLGLYQGGFPECQVGKVHVSAQIREQEFGNFQTVGLHEAARAEQAIVGRFYYRRPNAESSADVYDRVSAFWEELLEDVLPKQEKDYESCVVVTHGLTMRLILMKVFQWSVETLETVWNVGNCQYIALTKDMGQMCYQLCPQQSYPAQLPWASRPIWIVFRSKKADPKTEEKLEMLRKFKQSKDWGILKGTVADSSPGQATSSAAPAYCEEVSGRWFEIDRVIDDTENRRMKERSEPYTVLDYLTIPQPRTLQREALDGHLIPGHAVGDRDEVLKQAAAMDPLDWDDVECIDWWGPMMSYQGKMLRCQRSMLPVSRISRNLSKFPSPAQAEMCPRSDTSDEEAEADAKSTKEAVNSPAGALAIQKKRLW